MVWPTVSMGQWMVPYTHAHVGRTKWAQWGKEGGEGTSQRWEGYGCNVWDGLEKVLGMV